MGSYRDLRVWQQAMQLAVSIYRATESFPAHEQYGLTGQMRASVSVPSNIAEGKDAVRTVTSATTFFTPEDRCLNWKHRFCWPGNYNT